MPGLCVWLLPKPLKRASLSLAPIAALATWFTAGHALLWNLFPLTVSPAPGLQVSPHRLQCCKSVTSFISPPFSRPTRKVDAHAQIPVYIYRIGEQGRVRMPSPYRDPY